MVSRGQFDQRGTRDAHLSASFLRTGMWGFIERSTGIGDKFASKTSDSSFGAMERGGKSETGVR